MEPNQGAAAPNAEAAGQAQPNDEIKNLKAEMSRKLGNLEESNKQLMSFIDKLNQQNRAPAPAAAPEKKLQDIWFDNPEEAARIIEERTEARMNKRQAEHAQVQQRTQSTLQQLVAEFPELQDSTHDLFKKTMENYNGLTEDEKKIPLAYRAAVKEAALELGIKPKKMRKQDDEEGFSLSSSPQQRETRRQNKEVEAVTEELVKAFGLEMNPERKARIQNKHGRKSYTHWE